MTLGRYRIILLTLLLLVWGAFLVYAQEHSWELSSVVKIAIASTSSPWDIQETPTNSTTGTNIILDSIMSPRYIYTLTRYVESFLSSSIGKQISLIADYATFDDVRQDGSDFVLYIGSNEPIRIASSMYFFDRYNIGAEATLTGEISYPAKMIALTFDDGPSPRYTELLLDILKQEGVSATFFVLGRNAELYPNILKRIHNEWHEIGNHGYSHTLLTKLSLSKIQEEIYVTDQAIYRAIGSYPSLFRPPYGATNTGILANIPMVFALWSIDSRDWRTRSVARNIASIANARAWDIIIMHDIHEESVASVATIIAKLRSRGFTFVTVSDILELSSSNQQVGKRCYKQRDCR